MRRHGFPLLAICLCLLGIGCGGGGLRDETAEAPAGTPEATAKVVVREFVAGLRDGRREAVLTASDAPYFNHHNVGVIDTREELERAYEAVFTPWTRSGPLPKAMTGIRRYHDVRTTLKAPVRKLFDCVIGEDDFIVTLGDGPDEERFLLVRVREGVAKVVGVTTQ